MSNDLLEDLYEQVLVAKALGMEVPAMPGMIVHQIVAVSPSTLAKNRNPYDEEDEPGFEYSLLVKIQEDFKFSLGDLYASFEEAEAVAEKLNNGIHSDKLRYIIIPQMIR